MKNRTIAPARDSALGVSIEGLDFAFPGSSPLFVNFSLRFGAGITAILGPSGLGKSTLLRIVVGRLAPTHGTISGIDGLRISWMGQSGGLMPWASVEDNVLLGARLRGETPNVTKTQALLARLGLAGHETKRPAELSGGMRQRAALARVLMEDAEIVVLDEPFVHLDAAAKARLYSIAAQEFAGRIAVLVTHDPLEALALAQRVVVLAGPPLRIADDLSLAGAAPRDPRNPALNADHARIVAALEGA